VVDAIVRYWLSQVVGDGSENDAGIGRTARQLLVLFYADDGLIASRDHKWLQMAITRLAELFERMGLKTNTTKTQALNCTPGHITGPESSPAYKRRQEGTGDSFRERQRRRVECSQCGKDLAAGSLSVYMQTQHGLTRDGGVGRVDAPGRQPAVFTISFPKVTPTANCPIEGCPGTATSHVNLRRHFMHRHPRDTLIICEEGSVPLRKCENCGMHVPRSALHSSHPTTAWYRQGTEQAAAQRTRECTVGKRSSFLGRRCPSRVCIRVPVSWKAVVVDGQRLAGDIQEPLQGAQTLGNGLSRVDA
jgi:Zn ribbon nucleic-acid-binding protein